MAAHNWIPSTLGHGEAMCSRCFITNREAAILSDWECDRATGGSIMQGDTTSTDVGGQNSSSARLAEE